MPETVSCNSCGNDIQKGDRFCPSCGTTVAEPMDTATGQMSEDHGTNPTQCVSCSAPMGREDRFCPKCGTSRPEEATVVSHVSLRNAQAAHLMEATKGEFEIQRTLGTGAMGAVYLAKDISLSRQVAIKVIASNLLSDDTMISRFRLEAQTVANLRHPNIVNVHAVRQSDDLHYFVMEFIDGPPLRSIVKGHAPLDVEVVQSLMFQVGTALDYAHRTGGGVIHRDIKPANIMLDREGNAFVTDFGISKIAEAKTGLTQTGATIGTPEYMSPEQCRGEALTGSSDQYALGIVAYEMLCGNTPFSGSQYYIMVAHTSEDPKPIREVRPDCPPDVAEAVERMLAKTPEERWPDLDSAVTAMGGAPMGYRSPVRSKIVALTGATVMNVPTVDTGASKEAPAAEDTATSVTVSGIPSVVETGDSFTLAADVRGTGESSLTGMGVIWASTNPSIAKVEGGVVEALQPGVVSITATAGNVASSVLLTVAEPSPAAVLVRPGSVRIQRGGRISLSAAVQDKKGRDMDKPVRWSTSDDEVATVTEEGQVVATGTGSVSIVAESEGVTGTADIFVEAPAAATAPSTAVATPPTAEAPSVAEPEDAAAAPASPAAPAKSPAPAPAPAAKPAPPKSAPPKPKPKPKPKPSRPSRPKPQPSGGQPVYKRPPVIAASIVALLVVGFVVMNIGGGDPAPPVTPGSAPTTATTDPAPAGATDPAPAPTPTQTAENPAAQTDNPGGTPAPTPAPADPTPTAPAGTQPGTTTAATDPPTTGGAPAGGTPSGGGQQPAGDPTPPPAADPSPPPAAVTPAPSAVAISVPTTAMAVGGTQTASAGVFSAGGAPMSTGFDLTWRSTDSGILAVDARGAVRASGPGNAWLVATAGNARDSIMITVAAVVAAVEIAQADFSLEVGDARALSASATDAAGNALARDIAWSSSNPSVLTVDAGSGRVTAAGPGTAQVRATADGITGQVSVTVEEAAAALPSAADVESAIAGYLSTLSGGDEDAIRRLWGSADEDGLDDLIDLMGERGFAATLTSQGEATEQGGAVVVPFGVRAAYRNFAGAERGEDLNMVARFERSGAGWALASATVQ